MEDPHLHRLIVVLQTLLQSMDHPKVLSQLYLNLLMRKTVEFK